MNDDEYNTELETLRKRRMEELTTHHVRETTNLEELKMSDAGADWPNEPVNVSDSEFNEFIGKYPYVIIDCWAPWCGPCRMLGPVIDELAGDYKGKVVFAKLTTDDNQATAINH